MPKCSRCPIKKECNENPILVDWTPGKKTHAAGWRVKEMKVRLCPLLIAIGHAMQPPEPSKVSLTAG